MIMDRLYGGVCYAGIDTDPELKYPKVRNNRIIPERPSTPVPPSQSFSRCTMYIVQEKFADRLMAAHAQYLADKHTFVTKSVFVELIVTNSYEIKPFFADHFFFHFLLFAGSRTCRIFKSAKLHCGNISAFRSIATWRHR